MTESRRLVVRDGTDPIDLTDFVEEVSADAPPSLLDDPTELWPAHSGLHSTMLSTADPTTGAQSWQNLVEQLAAESRLVDDPQLRGALQCEAGRILIDRLGRKEEGELLLRQAASSSLVAKILQRSGTGRRRLIGLARDRARPQLERTRGRRRDLGPTGSRGGLDRVRAALRRADLRIASERWPLTRPTLEALTLCPDHPVALSPCRLRSRHSWPGETGKAAREHITRNSCEERSRLPACGSSVLLDAGRPDSTTPQERLIDPRAGPPRRCPRKEEAVLRSLAQHADDVGR